MREEPFEFEATSGTPVALALPDDDGCAALRAGEPDGRKALFINSSLHAASFRRPAPIFLPLLGREVRSAALTWSDVERLEAVVHGYVQGVGFRAFVTREGRRLGLAGTVSNREDGTVEVVAEGSRRELEELLQALHRGPSEAEVQRVEGRWLPAGGAFTGFRVRF
jgi:acylphosphatase